MNHFTAIGVPLYTEEDSEPLFREMLESATLTESTQPGYSYLLWQAGQGSEVWFLLNETTNTISNTTPAFKGKTHLRVGLIAEIAKEWGSPLAGELHAWANPKGDNPENGDYPLVFTWLDKGLHLPPTFPTICEVQITAFAHELTAYPSEAAYSAAEQQFSSGDTDDDLKVTFASESFIPSGMFVEEGEPMRPTAMFTGRVLETQELTSPLGNMQFHWIRVRTHGGEYDVVASVDVIEGELVTGGIVSGSFWLCGRMASP